jgi:hypothetical protein
VLVVPFKGIVKCSDRGGGILKKKVVADEPSDRVGGTLQRYCKMQRSWGWYVAEVSWRIRVIVGVAHCRGI